MQRHTTPDSATDTNKSQTVTHQEALHLAMQAMVGHSEFAYLGDIYDSARSQFGFDGSLEDALQALTKMDQVEVQPASKLPSYRVTCPHYDAFSNHPPE